MKTFDSTKNGAILTKGSEDTMVHKIVRTSTNNPVFVPRPQPVTYRVEGRHRLFVNFYIRVESRFNVRNPMAN